MSSLRLLPVISFAILAYAAFSSAQNSSIPVCQVNQMFNGQICTCAPGYFSSKVEESKARCEDECEEVYATLFTYGACAKGIFKRMPKDKQPDCNLRCGARIRFTSSIGLFCILAAAIATLLFTLPMCIATCSSCLHAKKANKNARRVYEETTQQQQPNKDQQAVATMGYNPYAYWPYYGRN
uniref:WSC domain-containing protein n=1 Tax=Rhabditophanes sp. KR3021 TaxID=114890 RepID=A0AC35TTW7_9BILA